MAEESPYPQPHSPTSSSSDPTLSRSGSFSRLSARAPKFDITPRGSSSRPNLHPPPHHRLSIPPPPPPAALHHVDSPSPNSPFHLLPMQDHFLHPHASAVQYPHHQPPPHHPHNQYHGADQDAIVREGRGDHPNPKHKQVQAPAEQDEGARSKNGLSDEAVQKVLNQVEYYFSDIHLATTDHLMRFISKDLEGYVPIAVVASFKKIKALITSNSQLSSILQNSSKLVVSEDGKKVKRRYPLTDSDMEELQSRVVIAENLPEDHCHQNLMKLFSAIGSLKAIRIRQPQASYGGASLALRSGKADGMHYTNKLHAFVEYESTDVAEKAVEELNDEGNWRSGLRVRLIHRRGSKPSQALGKKGHDGEEPWEDEDDSISEQQPSEKQLDEPFKQSDAYFLGKIALGMTRVLKLRELIRRLAREQSLLLEDIRKMVEEHPMAQGFGYPQPHSTTSSSSDPTPTPTLSCSGYFSCLNAHAPEFEPTLWGSSSHPYCSNPIEPPMDQESPSEILDSYGSQPHSSTSSFSDPTLSCSRSFSRLSARAPKFDITPRGSSSHLDLHPPPHHRLSIRPPPPPAALHHVDPPSPNSPFHLLPMQDHFPHPHASAVQYHHHRPPPHHPHNQYNGADQDAVVHEGCDDHPNPKHKQIQAPAEQDEGAPSKNGLNDEAVQKILNQACSLPHFEDSHLEPGRAGQDSGPSLPFDESCQDTVSIPFCAKCEKLSMELEAEKISSAIQVDCLTTMLIEAKLVSDNVTCPREPGAHLVVEQLHDQIKILENEKTLSWKNLDNYFEMVAENKLSVEKKFEDSKRSQPRGKKGHDGEEPWEDEDASLSEQQPSEKKLGKSFEQSDAHFQGTIDAVVQAYLNVFNYGSKEELTRLHGISERKAAAIIGFRDLEPFISLDDVENVRVSTKLIKKPLGL